MQDIQITTLTKDTLKEALDQNLYWKENNKVVPFSKKKPIGYYKTNVLKATMFVPF